MSVWQRMTLRQKTFTLAVLTVGVAVVLYVFSRILTSDPPIYIADGSVTFQADAINQNSNMELEEKKFLHKVRSLVVTNADGSAPSTPIDLKGTNWKIASASGKVVVTNDPQLAGLQEGVKADCPQSWTGGGTNYSCDPGDGSQLTPATLTIATQSFSLSCPTGKCIVQLAYK
jgi:hypothetical protein